jgi:hypothetical protein
MKAGFWDIFQMNNDTNNRGQSPARVIYPKLNTYPQTSTSIWKNFHLLLEIIPSIPAKATNTAATLSLALLMAVGTIPGHYLCARTDEKDDQRYIRLCHDHEICRAGVKLCKRSGWMTNQQKIILDDNIL